MSFNVAYFSLYVIKKRTINYKLMDQSFINRLAAIAITSLLLVIGVVLLKTTTLNDVTTPRLGEYSVTIYEEAR